MILANIRRLPPPTCHTTQTTCHPQPAAYQTMPAICQQPHIVQCLASATQQVSALSVEEYTSQQIVKWDWKCLPQLRVYMQGTRMCTWERTRGSSSECLESGLGRSVLSSRLWMCHRVQLGVYLRACLRVWLRASWELTWEHIVKYAGSVSFSAIGSVLASMLWTVIESILRSYLGTYSHAGWECAIKSNWQHPVDHAQECTWEHTGSRAWERTWSARGRALSAYLGAYSEPGCECVIECNWECTWECEQQCNRECLASWLWNGQSTRQGMCHRVQLGAAWRPYLGVLENILGDVPRSILKV